MSFTKYKVNIENYLNNILSKLEDKKELTTAIRYVCLNGGKRIRPCLVYATGEMLGVAQTRLHAAAASIELIHCYTLVHDDLPAMDNDDIRRGKPSCHKAFSESIAILVGDALQALAFEILSDPKFNPISANQRIQQVNILSKAIGATGLVLGQAEDIAAENNKTINIYDLKSIYEHKTATLFQASVELALQTNNEYYHKIGKYLVKYAKNLGLLFQIQDDILNLIGNPSRLGKTVGIDQKNIKSTYPGILGLDTAKQEAYSYLIAILNTIDIIESFGVSAIQLKKIAYLSFNRLN